MKNLIILIITIILLSPITAYASDYTLYQGDPFVVYTSAKGEMVEFIGQKLWCIDKCYLSVHRNQKAGVYPLSIGDKKYEVDIKDSHWEVNRFTLPPATESKLSGNAIADTWAIINSHIYNSTHIQYGFTDFITPTEGRISMDIGEYVYINNKYNGSHFGVDIANYEGTPVYTAHEGRVVFAGDTPSYGLVVIIDHGYGVMSMYAHMSKIFVYSGEILEDTSRKIGDIGMTGVASGPHLHWSIFVQGVISNPHKWEEMEKIVEFN